MRKSAKYIFTACLLGASLLSSCKRDVPSDVIAPEQMEDVLYDYHIAQAMGNEFNGKERYKKELLLRYVFEKHHITQADFDSSLVWYARNTKELDKLYENIDKRFETSRKNLEALIDPAKSLWLEPLVGDSVNLWLMPALYRLSDMELRNKMLFTIPATDTTYKQRDRYVWELQAHLLSTDSLITGDSIYLLPNTAMELSLRYKNDSTTTVSLPIQKGLNRIYIQADTMKLEEIKGMVYFGNDTLSPKGNRSLLLHSISLMRNHLSDKELQQITEAEMEAKEDSIVAPIETEIPQNEPPVKVEAESKDSVKTQEPKRLTPQQLREQNRTQPTRKHTKPTR